MPDTLRLAGSERSRHRLRLQRRRYGQQRRALLILCRRQVQGFDWQCRVQRLWGRDLFAKHWRCVIANLSELRIWDLLADNRGHISQHMLGMPDALALSGSERSRHRLCLQRGGNGQQRRSLLILCRRQVQGFDWQCRMQRLWSGDLLAEHWRHIVRHLHHMSDSLRLAGSERGRHRLRLQRGRNWQQWRTLLPVCCRQV